MTPSLAAPRADFSEAAIAARVAELRPALEEALGVPLPPPIRVETVGRREMADLLLAEEERFLDGFEREPGSRGTLAAAAALVLGKTDLETGRILIQPAAFGRLGRLFPALDGLLDRDFLDLILIHEMVHLHQHRRFDLADFVRGARSFETAQCRLAVLEGHAQHVTRRVARERGVEPSLDLLVRLNSGAAAHDLDASLMVEAATAWVGLSYVAGERFFSALAARRGDAEAVELAFARPPTRLPELLRPEEYLAPPVGPDLRRVLAGERARLAGPGSRARTRPLTRELLRAAAGPSAEGADLRGFRDGVWCAVEGPDARWSVALIEFDGAEAAAGFLAVERRTVLAGEDVSSARVRPVAGEGGTGFAATVVRRDAAADGGETRSVTVVLRRGRFVVEVGVVGAGAGRALAEARSVASAL